MITLEQALARQYPFVVTVEPEGGWAIRFPDLPGCTAYAESFDEIGPMARTSLEIWLRSEMEQGHPIPEPTIGTGRGWSANDFDVSSGAPTNGSEVETGADTPAARSA
jgi:predicted RNase H-like HicB family nuclease